MNTATADPSTVFDSTRFSRADELARHMIAAGVGGPEAIIEACRLIAATQGLSEGEYAHLLAQELLKWERDHTKSAPKGWAVNAAVYALEAVSEDDPFWPLIDPVVSMLESIGDWRDGRQS